MKNSSRFISNFIITAALLAAPLARAATETWTGGGGSGNLFWLSTANWNPASLPQSGDTLVFTNTVGLVNSNNYADAFSFANITFATPSGAFALSGNRITLTSGITDNQPFTPESLNLPVILSGSVTATLTTNAILNLNNVVSGSGSLTVSGAGAANLLATNSFSGGLNVVGGGTVAINTDSNLGVGNIVINGGTLQSLPNLTLVATRNIAVGPSSGSGSGTLNVTIGTTLNDGVAMSNNGGGTGGLTKVGFGTLVLSGANTYTGPTTNTIGFTTLDFTQAGSPANNIINSASSLSMGTGNSGLTAVNFAELLMAGKVGSANSQSFTGANFLRGASVIVATNAGGGTANLALGALSHTPGSAVKFVTSSQTGGGNVTTTSGNIGGILGGWATISGDASTPSLPSNNLITGTNYACVDLSGNIVNFNNYFAVNAANSNILLHATVDANTTGVATNILVGDAGGGAIVARIDIDGAGTTTDINSIKIFNSPSTGGAGVFIGTNNTLRLGVYGGILSVQTANTTPVIGGVSNMVNGITANQAPFGSQDAGTLTAGGPNPNTPGEIVITHYTSQGETTGGLIVAAKIADNGPGGTVTVVKMGNGSIKLDGDNTYSGGLYMLEGRVQWQGTEIAATGNGGPGGTNGINDGAGYGPVYILPGAYFAPSTAIPNITNDFFVAGVGDAQENFGVFRAGNIGGSVTLIGDAAFCSDAANIFGPIHGPFNLTLGAPGRKGTLSLANTNNDWTGNTFMSTRSDNNVLISSNNEVIPNGFGKGNVIMTNSAAANIFRWNMNGFSETVNGLSTSPNFGAGCLITSSNGVTSTLTVGDNDQSGTFGGIISNTIALTKIGAGVETLTNLNFYNRATTISNGVLQLTGIGSIANSPNVNINGGTFDVSVGNYTVPAGQTIGLNGGIWFISTASSSTTPVGFTNGTLKVTSMNTVSANLTVGTLNIGSGPNFIQPANMPLIPAYPVTFPIIKYTTLNGSAATFSANLPAGYVGSIVNDTGNSQLVLTLTSGPVTPSLTWFGFNGGALNSSWDFVASDWTNIPAHHADSYADGSLVTFDNTGLTNVVNLTAIFAPAGVTVTNNASGANATYVFTGTGAISGTNGVTKQGGGKLILDNTGGDSYTGGLSIGSGGTVQVGINDTAGSLGAPSGNVGDNGLLVFNRANSIVISNSISGTGSLLVSNASGTSVQISGGNSFSGPATFVTGLTIQPNNNTAFGTTNSGTTIASGSTLDVQAPGLGVNALTMPEPIVISGDGTDGNGAIINAGANNQQNALQRVTLTANTSVGGSGGRLDIRGTAGGANGFLNTGGVNYNLTKKGGNIFGLVNLAVDPALGNVDIQGGTLEIGGATTGLGNSLSNLTVAASTTLQVAGLANPLNKNIIMAGNANLTAASGTNTVSGPITLNGTINVAVQGRGVLNLNGAISGAGGLTDNGTNALVLNGINSYSGGTVVNDGVFILNGINNNAANTLLENSSQAGFPTVVVGGNGTNVAAVTIENILHPGASGHPSTFGSGNLFIDGGNAGVLIMDLGSSTTVGSGVNDWLNVAGNIDVNFSTMLVNPVGLLATNAPYTLATYTGSRPSTFSGSPDVVPSAKPSRYTFTFNYDDANSRILLNVTTGAGSMVWSNATGNGIWDLANTKNWFNRNKAGGSLVDPTDYQFFQSDAAILDDTAAFLGTTLTITNALTNGVIPSTVVFDATSNYTITGPGKITGSAAILKKNTGTLTISNMVNNDFTGSTLIQGGTVVIDAAANGNSSLGAIPGGNVIITNGGTLDIGGSANANSISFTNLAINATKQFLIAGNGVGGNGAIVNNGSTAQQNALQAITLTANASIGGTNRWDLRGAGGVVPNLNLNGFTLTKTGSNQVSLVNVIITNTGSIVVNGGTFSVETASVVSNNTITINSGGAFGHFRTASGAILSPITLNGGALTNLSTSGGASTNDATITLTANSSIRVQSGSDLVLNGVISGASFGLTKIGPGAVVLTTNDTYSGDTVINAGSVSLSGNGAISSSANIILSTNTSTVDVSARANTTLTLASGQTLAGIGVVNGTLSNAVGSTVSPGVSSIGILTVTNGNANLRGTTSMDLNKSVSPSNDVLVVSGNVNYGGTLSLNITGTLAGGDNFKLFNAGTYGGAFSSISPATPGAGLTWNTNNLAINGTISVVSSGPPAKPVFTGGITISGTTLSFSATNGSAGGTWTLLGSTNIALPFASWTTVTNGTFDGSGNVSFSGANLINLVKPQTFYLLQTP